MHKFNFLVQTQAQQSCVRFYCKERLKQYNKAAACFRHKGNPAAWTAADRSKMRRRAREEEEEERDKKEAKCVGDTEERDTLGEIQRDK